MMLSFRERLPVFAPQLEKSYRDYFIESDVRTATFVLLAMFVPQLALVTNDRRIVASDETFWALVVLRTFGCGFGLWSVWYLRRGVTPRRYDRLIALHTLMGMPAFAFIAWTRPASPVGFFVSGIMIVGVFYFVLPGRLWYRIVGALGVSLILAMVPFSSETPWYLQNHVVPILMFHVLAIPVLLQEERSRRTRYLAVLRQERTQTELQSQAEALAEARAELASANQELERRIAAGLHELRLTNESLAASNAELVRANKAKDIFLATVSHELRTPLNAMLIASEAILEGVYGPIGDRTRRPLATIRESGLHLSRMIGDVLDLVQIESGHSKLELERVDVAEVLQAVAGMLHDEARLKPLTLRVAATSGDLAIVADRRRLTQIVLNLASNAVKFTPEGGHVELACEDRGEQGVRLCVRDDGIGIEPEDQQRIFEPFVQLDAGLDRRHGGAGLGLLLVRDLTALHGGRIEVRSEPGEGSCFYVELPRVAAAATTNTSSRRAPA